MDGIAIKYNDKINSWKLIGEIRAGIYNEIQFTENETVSIFTGAKIPPFADTVIPVENLNFLSEGVVLKEGLKFAKYQNIRFQGEDLKKGEVAIPELTKISSFHIHSIATCGVIRPIVIKKPTISIISTGEELISPDKFPLPGQVRASNSYSLYVQCKEAGFQPKITEYVKDNSDKIANMIQQESEDSDVIFTTGGASIGKYDFLSESLNKIKAKILFHETAIKPGKPMLFSIYYNGRKNIPIFSLPGNPVSSFVNFMVYIRPILQEICYVQRDTKSPVAKLSGKINKKDGKRYFVRGRLDYANGEFLFHPVGAQSSADMNSLGHSDCLGVISEEMKNPEPGEKISCILM
jgi:molybdopterin molybdotransferase